MDFTALRKQFPVYAYEDIVYLDTAASSLTPQAVIDGMNEYYTRFPVNVHRGVYRLSYQATEAYTAARETVAKFIKASFEEIIFTRGASSALNLVAFSYGLSVLKPGDEIILSALEHHSNLLPWQAVAKQTGAVLKFVPLDPSGRITAEAFASTLSKKTRIVALTYVSNVMGYITPLKPIIALAHEQGAVVVVDAAQAAPHHAINVKELDCDFLAFSGHKMCGPTGIGVLYGKAHLLKAMPPIEYGGDMNDHVTLHDAVYKDPPYRFETGTPPIAEALGLASAIRFLQDIGLDAIAEHARHLREKALAGIEAISGITVYNPTTETGIITFNLDDVHPHDAVTYFDADGIALRAGHHCAQTVMQWLQVDATLRASFYLYNTDDDVKRFLDTLRRARTFFTEAGF
ncbi:MAG: cysteine desulfurase [Acholeplasmatales bacterium]|nr:MAG: cysteine desulfurase [Acholeplasmatales bacterium]